MEIALIWAGTLLAGLAIIAGASLVAWRAWIDLRTQQTCLALPAADEDDQPAGVRIELAAMKERLRKLEAIAQGVDP